MKFEDIKEVSLREDGNVVVEAARVSLPGKSVVMFGKEHERAINIAASCPPRLLLRIRRALKVAIGRGETVQQFRTRLTCKQMNDNIEETTSLMRVKG